MYISGRPRTHSVVEDDLEFHIVLHPASKSWDDKTCATMPNSFSSHLFSFSDTVSYTDLELGTLQHLPPNADISSMGHDSLLCCLVLLVIPVLAQDAMVSVAILNLSSPEMTGLYNPCSPVICF